MSFNFILNKFFKNKLIKGFPSCPNCPPRNNDCDNPCGCDCGGGGGCASCGDGGGGAGGCAGCGEGGEGGGGYGVAGEVLNLEDQVEGFFNVGQVGYDPGPDPRITREIIQNCFDENGIKQPPKKCKDCAGMIRPGAGKIGTFGFQCIIRY